MKAFTTTLLALALCGACHQSRKVRDQAATGSPSASPSAVAEGGTGGSGTDAYGSS